MAKKDAVKPPRMPMNGNKHMMSGMGQVKTGDKHIKAMSKIMNSK